MNGAATYWLNRATNAEARADQAEAELARLRETLERAIPFIWKGEERKAARDALRGTT